MFNGKKIKELETSVETLETEVKSLKNVTQKLCQHNEGFEIHERRLYGSFYLVYTKRCKICGLDIQISYLEKERLLKEREIKNAKQVLIENDYEIID